MDNPIKYVPKSARGSAVTRNANLSVGRFVLSVIICVRFYISFLFLFYLWDIKWVFIQYIVHISGKFDKVLDYFSKIFQTHYKL